MRRIIDETGASSPAQVVAAKAKRPAATPAFQRKGRFGGQVRRDRLRRTGGGSYVIHEGAGRVKADVTDPGW
jgi:hypothetical protein